MTQTTALTQQDIKIYPSERLTDTADGGGLMRGTPLTGADNELFPPVSDKDRTLGAFNARLVYAGVTTQNQEVLYGAHHIISTPPTAPNTSFVLFAATKWGETRAEILQRIEAFNVRTIESRMTMLSTQSMRSRIIQAYQRPEEPLPQVGDVYCLDQSARGYPQHEEYIQVIKVESENRTFYDPQTQKEFVRAVVKMEISSPLTADYIGVDYPSITGGGAPCKIRETGVADAGKYYGVKPLSAAIQAQAMKLSVPSLMEKLVPTAQVETSLLDLTAAGQQQILIRSGRENEKSVSIYKNNYVFSETTFYFGSAILPGSIYTTYGYYGNYTDDGAGTLYRNGNIVAGTVDYARGTLTISTGYPNGFETIRASPAAVPLQVSDTASIAISINSRSYNYVETITPPPTPGSLQVSYRAQERWYDLRDDGTGTLSGLSAAYGSASVNYKTGTVALTCGEMPDVGSEILLTWTTTAEYTNRANTTPKAGIILQLSQQHIAPNTLQLSWSGGTAQDDGAGNITGNFSGTIDYRTGQIKLNPPSNLDVWEITANYSHGEGLHKTFNAPLRNGTGQVTLDLNQINIKPKTFRMRWNLLIEDYSHLSYGAIYTRKVDPYQDAHDDGAGKVVSADGVEFGTIDYVTGVITFNPDTTVKIPKATYSKAKVGTEIMSRSGFVHGIDTQEVRDVYRNVFTGYEYIPAGASMPIDDSAVVDTWYRADGTDDAFTEVVRSDKYTIDLLPNVSDAVTAGSVNITVGNRTYVDRRGDLYYDIDPNTGAGTLGGSIDYSLGIATLDNYRGSTNIRVNALVSELGVKPVDEVTFRTPSAPIRPQSLVMTATTAAGKALQIRADAHGEIDGNGFSGHIDYETGVVRCRFGEWVDAAGKENEPWYNVNAVKDGKIFKSEHVIASSINYSAVAYSYLPLDSTQIGINSVRLPTDGRVPIFRRGDMIVIGNRQKQGIGSAHTGGQIVQLNRTNLDRICVLDADGKNVNAEKYTVDLSAGTLTWADPLDLSEYQMPLTVHHAQEEENRVVAVDISGELTLQFPVSRDYPQEDTYVSSALVGSDLQVRVSPPWAQKNWNNVWVDNISSDVILARLNVKDYPIELRNDGAISERWAIVFRTDTQFRLYGETLGLVLESDTLTDLAPINPATNQPYFTLPHLAFGGGWSNGNTIRFNTMASIMPVWILRAVQPSSQRQQGKDGFTQCLRGNTIDL